MPEPPPYMVFRDASMSKRIRASAKSNRCCPAPTAARAATPAATAMQRPCWSPARRQTSAFPARMQSRRRSRRCSVWRLRTLWKRSRLCSAQARARLQASRPITGASPPARRRSCSTAATAAASSAAWASATAPEPARKTPSPCRTALPASIIRNASAAASARRRVRRRSSRSCRISSAQRCSARAITTARIPGRSAPPAASAAISAKRPARRAPSPSTISLPASTGTSALIGTLKRACGGLPQARCLFYGWVQPLSLSKKLLRLGWPSSPTEDSSCLSSSFCSRVSFVGVSTTTVTNWSPRVL